MKNSASRGIITVGLAIFIVIALVVVAAGAYLVHQHFVASAAVSATSTSSGTEASSTPSISVPAPPDVGSVVVTGADTGKPVYLHPGARFLLQLGDTINWSNIEVADPAILSPVVNIPVIKGAQGVYGAQQKGTTTLSATGSAICVDGQPCPQFMLLFRVVIVVD